MFGSLTPTLRQELTTSLMAKSPLYCGITHHTESPFAQDYSICAQPVIENSLHCGHSNNTDLVQALDLLQKDKFLNSEQFYQLQDLLLRSKEVKFYLIDAFPMILKHVTHFKIPRDLRELDSFKIPVLPTSNSFDDLSLNLKTYTTKLQELFGSFSIGFNNLIISLMKSPDDKKAEAEIFVERFIEKWQGKLKPFETLALRVKESELFDKISQY